MTDYETTLLKLKKNLNILQERKAKYGGNAPLDLINQIEDHEQAIALTQQVITDELSEDEWREALKPLLLAMNNGQVVNIETGVKKYITNINFLLPWQWTVGILIFAILIFAISIYV